MEGAAPTSKAKLLAIELAIVKSRAGKGEADLRLLDRGHQIADCLTKHASRKSEEVPQHHFYQAQWSNATEDII